MAAIVSVSQADEHSLVKNQTLSDDQIEQLLQQAEQRLTEQQADSAVALRTSDSAVAIPRPSRRVTDAKPFVSSDGPVTRVDDARLLDPRQRESANGVRRVEDPLVAKQNRITVAKAVQQEKKATAGAKWFNMPKTNLTPELKRDWQLIKMRNVLDPHRHYKKDNAKAPPPAFSQVGTLVEGPTEYFSGRLQNSERKRTLAEEILAGEKQSGRFKRKYGEIQDSRTSGKRGHYKAQMEKRYGSSQKRGKR